MFTKARALLAVPAVFAVALIGSPLATATTTPTTGTPTAAPATAQPFIMGDGRICNPRWGC